jgi:uncharacterized membrane protein YuzA (DUF378 family)
MKKLSWWLLVIGGLNWLLVGLFQKDLFLMLGIGMDSLIARLVYILVGLGTVYLLFSGKKSMKTM